MTKRDNGKRCSVLVVAENGTVVPQQATLEAIGFHVECAEALPCDASLLAFEAVIAILPAVARVGPFAARARAQRHFGHRALIALVPDTVPEIERRRAAAAGMDAVLPVSAGGRDLAARILARLRQQPEHRCSIVPRPPKHAA